MTGHVIHLDTTIQATPEAIWSVLTDLPRAAEVLRSVKSVELLTDGEYDVGTAWKEERTFFGHHGTEELHVTEADAPRRTLHETRLGHDRIRAAYSIQSLPDGSSKLGLTATLDVSERTPREKVMWNAFGGHSYNATRKMLQQDLDDIRKAAEAQGGQQGGQMAGRHRAS